MLNLPVLADAAADAPSMIESPAGLLAVLLTVLAVIFWTDGHPVLGRIFKVIPALVFCYFIPTTLTALNVIPAKSEFYAWVKDYVLLAALLLLTLSLDLPEIIRLGHKPVVMLLAGTAGVVIGGPLALMLWKDVLPEDAWKTMAYLAGSWIGGGANAVALQKSFGVSDAAVSPMIVVDVAVANVWMGILLFFAARHRGVDRLLRSDTTAITALENKMRDFQKRVARIPSLADLMMILALGFGFAWLSNLAGGKLFARLVESLPDLSRHIGPFMLAVMTVTAIGIGLSFTRLRSLEGAGASRIGSVMIYLLVACIGAGGDFSKVLDSPEYIGFGATWMLFHILILLITAIIIRAPFFFVAVGSQANIGGAASAPVVAGAFNPVLAPVGVLLAIAGYALGTYAGWICIQLCRMVVGA